MVKRLRIDVNFQTDPNLLQMCFDVSPRDAAGGGLREHNGEETEKETRTRVTEEGKLNWIRLKVFTRHTKFWVKKKITILIHLNS